MAIEQRVSKLEKRLAMTSAANESVGEIVIYDPRTGEVLRRTATGGDVSLYMPDNGREPAIRDGPRDGTYVSVPRPPRAPSS